MKKNMFMGASHLIFERAKDLRNNQTHAETLLWGYLRQKPLGHKFRRQHPISIYVADFYFHSLKLIIEIDGSVHGDLNVSSHDAERQKNLEADGIKFLRFTNHEVEKELETVIKEIENYIINHPQTEGKPL
jgi:imidazole glycerol-phosphate synthase subunit HisF